MRISYSKVLVVAALSVSNAFAAPQLGVTIGTTIGTFTFPIPTPTTTTKTGTTATFQIPPSDTFALGDVSRITNIFASKPILVVYDSILTSQRHHWLCSFT